MTAKRVMKEKTKEALPGKVEGSRRPNKAAILAALAAIGGAVWFWRRRSDDEPSSGYDDRPSGESDLPSDHVKPADDAGPAVAEK